MQNFKLKYAQTFVFFLAHVTALITVIFFKWPQQSLSLTCLVSTGLIMQIPFASLRYAKNASPSMLTFSRPLSFVTAQYVIDYRLCMPCLEKQQHTKSDIETTINKCLQNIAGTCAWNKHQLECACLRSFNIGIFPFKNFVLDSFQNPTEILIFLWRSYKATILQLKALSSQAIKLISLICARI